MTFEDFIETKTESGERIVWVRQDEAERKIQDLESKIETLYGHSPTCGGENEDSCQCGFKQREWVGNWVKHLENQNECKVAQITALENNIGDLKDCLRDSEFRVSKLKEALARYV